MQELLSKIKMLVRTGFLHIFGGSIINNAISFLSSTVLVHILSKSEYGTFTNAWNIYGIVLLFNGLGIDSGVLQLSSEHGGEEQYVKQITGYGVKVGLRFNVILSLTLLCIGLFAPLKIQGAKSLLVMLCLLPMAQMVYQLINVYLRAQKRNKEYAALNTFKTVMLFIVSAVSALLFREKGMVLGHYFSYIAAIILSAIVYRVRLPLQGSVPDEERKALFSISAISMCNNGLSQLLYLLDLFVLSIVDPRETLLASYKVATIIPTALTFIPLALVTYLYPKLAERRKDPEWVMKQYKRILLVFGGFNIVVSGVLFAGAPLIIRIVFGSEYLEAVPVFRILSANYFFSSTFRVLSGNILVTQRKLKFNLFVAVLASAVNIAADYFFIQWWGSIGAALATVTVVLVSGSVSTAYLVYTLKKAIKGNMAQ
ncbi:MAG: oligosaccharide flippase family protein [Oscillospiraceae bacterium]|nr:oligosaccharide flippase family protein [Oscillospiraceae bacterium]